MKLGIVGLPNVGKSTLFNAITSTKNAEAANYPFCTIEPNSGIVAVPDKRLDKLAEIWQTNKKTPAIVEFVDIAGLVKGASQGAGLGNKFLGHIRECDAIVHVVRCFDDDNIIHVVEDVSKAEAVDPIADIDAIDYELILSDLEVVQNRAGRMAKAAKSGNNKGAAAEAAWLQKLADHLSAGKPARSFDFDEGDAEQQAVLHEMGLLSAKPVLYACNVGEDDLMEGIENNKYVPLVAARAKEEGARYIPICAKTEEDIAGSTQEEKIAFLQQMPGYDVSLYIHKKNKSTLESSTAILSRTIECLTSQEDWSEEALLASMTALAGDMGLKLGPLTWPVRIALSGLMATPGGARDILYLLGKEESLRRLADGIRLIEKENLVDGK